MSEALEKIAAWVDTLGQVGWSAKDKSVLAERVAFAAMMEKRKATLDFIAHVLRLDIVPRSIKGYNLSYVGRITLVSLFTEKTLDISWPGK